MNIGNAIEMTKLHDYYVGVISQHYLNKLANQDENMSLPYCMLLKHGLCIVDMPSTP